jgi:hypothetical protein
VILGNSIVLCYLPAMSISIRKLFRLPVVILFMLLLAGCFGGGTLHEKDYQQFWCNKHHGTLEYRLDDGTRVDCLTSEYAVEVDFAHKWAEAIGQALFYSKMTSRKPGVLLIMHERGDNKFLKRLRKVAAEQGIRIWTIKPHDLDI